MVGRLRAAHARRFELPLVSQPVEFGPRDVPMDPYALGLLLGDGCLTTSTTPSFTTGDPELALALEAALDGIELRRKSQVDYVLRHTAGHRGGVIVANPLTAALRDLGLAGARSSTKFVPDSYLHNSSEVRLAVLQGLLDTDGGPVTQHGRTCRVQYGTCSARLRDDVVLLVRSLGGVAYWRTRAAAGRTPGRVQGRDVHHRSDSYALDIRLPQGIEPFRLARKREAYRAFGGGRPMRFIDSIEPAGEAETLCIQVAAADSLYVTDDFLVTHNTLNDSFIVLDEAQNVKNSAARQSQAVRSLRAPRRVALTGTPVENRLAELWSIMEFLNPGLLGSRQAFERTFARPIEAVPMNPPAPVTSTVYCPAASPLSPVLSYTLIRARRTGRRVVVSLTASSPLVPLRWHPGGPTWPPC